MSDTLNVPAGSTIEFYSMDTPIIPESQRSFDIKNNGPAEVTARNYWGAPFMIGGWNDLNTITIKPGETKRLLSGTSSFYHYKAEVTNNSSTESADLDITSI